METKQKKNKVNTVVDYHTNEFIKAFKSGVQEMGIPMDCVVANIPMTRELVYKLAESKGMSKVMFLTALEDSLNKSLNKEGVKVLWQRVDRDNYRLSFMPFKLYNELYKVA